MRLSFLNSTAKSVIKIFNALFIPKKNLALFAAASLADVFGGMGSWNDDAVGWTQYKNVVKSSTKSLIANLYANCTKPYFLP